MNRRDALKLLAAAPLMPEVLGGVEAADGFIHAPQQIFVPWQNYTTTYTVIDKPELVERIRAAIEAARQREIDDFAVQFWSPPL